MKEKTGLQKFWEFAKPIAIITLAGFGYFTADQDVPKTLFLMIGVLSVVLRGRAIGAGFLALYDLIKPKKTN
jgi:hypothetical protein